MRRRTRSLVLGVMDAVNDELPDVIILQPVEDGGSVPARLGDSGHSQFRQVLRHRCRPLLQHLGQFSNGALGIEQGPDDADAGRVGQHPEQLDCEINLVGQRLSMHICIHMQILDRFVAGGEGLLPREYGRTLHGADVARALLPYRGAMPNGDTFPRPVAWLFAPFILAFIQVFGTFGAAHGQPEARPPDVLAVVLALTGPAALLLLPHRTRPLLVTITLATFAYLVIGYPFGPVFASFAVAVVIAVMRSRRLEAWSAVVIVLGVANLIRFAVHDLSWSWAWFAGASAWALVILGFGELMRLNRARQREARSRRGAAADRARTARCRRSPHVSDPCSGRRRTARTGPQA
jgi:hypothetical protein